jgi:hypothetical protein
MRHPVLRQIFYRMLGYLGGRAPSNRNLGVGILGYAPSIGKIHGIGVQRTSGLELKAVCDLNATRRNQAALDFPGVAVQERLRQLAQDPGVELVIVATPPNTHSELCRQLLTAGKHVVCEKPLALNRREAETMAETADNLQLHLSCHQNRRWDPVQIRFEGGREAESLHSDIAAVRKPKWYILGSGGAILGNWRDVTAFQADSLLYFHEDRIPAT